MPNRYDVFISHSTANRKWATDLATSLKDQGLRVFDVTSASASASIEETIRQGLRDSSYVVVVLDQSSVTSVWSAFEIGAAIGSGKQVVPIVMSDIPVDRLPEPVQHLQTIRVDSANEAAEKVIELIQHKTITRP